MYKSIKISLSKSKLKERNCKRIVKNW